MAVDPGFSMFNPGTGANQYTDQNYALPALSPTASVLGPSASLQSTGDVTSSTASPVAPGIVPPSSLPANPVNVNAPGGFDPNNPTGPSGGIVEQPGQGKTVSTLYPNFTNEFYNFLSGQMGKGATPFNLQSVLPSSGQATAPGTLNAPLGDVNSMLQQFYKTGTGGPTGTAALASNAATGNPTDVGPAWEAMKAAEQRTIDQQGANLREQFAFGGDLKSSPFAQAATDYYSQTAKDQNAALTAAQQQAQEAAAGRQLTAGQDLTSGASSMGQYLQGLDQASIQNLLAEFIRTSPEYSPLLSQIGGAATTFPPSMSGSVGVGGLGGAVSSAGSALSGIADLWSTLNKSGSTTQTPAG